MLQVKGHPFQDWGAHEEGCSHGRGSFGGRGGGCGYGQCGRSRGSEEGGGRVNPQEV